MVVACSSSSVFISIGKDSKEEVVVVISSISSSSSSSNCSRRRTRKFGFGGSEAQRASGACTRAVRSSAKRQGKGKIIVRYGKILLLIYFNARSYQATYLSLLIS